MRGPCRDSDLHEVPARALRRIRANSAIEGLNCKIRRRTRVVGRAPAGRASSCSHRGAQVRGRERVGIEALPGHDDAGGVAASEGGPMGLLVSEQIVAHYPASFQLTSFSGWRMTSRFVDMRAFF